MVDYLNNVRNRFLSVFFRSYMMMTEAMEGTSAETEGRRKFLAVSLVSSFKFDCLSCRLCLFFYLQCPDSDD